MSKHKSPERIGLFVHSRVEGDYFHVLAHPVIIGATAYEMRMIDSGAKDIGHIPHERIRNAGDDLVNGLYLGNLRVTSQGNQDASPRRLYGFDVEYRDVFAIDRRSAERMAKTLKTIETRMAKLADKFGHPATFGQYLARVANAIGAKFTVHTVGKAKHWSYAENEHRILDLAAGISYVDGLVREWAEPRQEAATG